jgi:polysaccharide biosynthesis transport protein
MKGEMIRRGDGAGGGQLAPSYPAGGGLTPGSAGGSGNGAADLQQRNVLQILWRGRWFILLGIVAAIGGGLFYLSKQTPIYASSSRILVEPDVKIISNDVTGQSRAGNYLQTQCELIMSSQILAPVASLPELGAMRTFQGVDNPIGRLRAGISATVGQKDDLITISFESPYAPEAASVVNAVVDSYKEYQASRKKSTAAEVLRILTAEKRERDRELREQTKHMLEFKQKNPNLSFTSEKGNIIIEQLGRLSDSLTTARLAVLDAKGELDAAKSIESDPSRVLYWIRAQENNVANPLVAEVQRLELELATTGKAMLQEHATRKAQQTRLEELRLRIEAQAKDAFQAYMATVEAQYARAKTREDELQKSFTAQQKEALALNTQSTEYAMLEADARRLEKLCDLLDSRIKEVQITEGAGPLNISVLEEARAGGAPVKPKRSTVLFQAMMLGLMAGCGLAYLRDWADQRLSSVEEVQSRLGLNVLGVLPHMPDRETPSVRGQKVQLDPMSEIAEAYRTVRTAVFFGAPEDKAKTILVTSPTPGDGKTTTTSNLAIAIAQAGQRVLLMDCDFRKPMQHRIFDIQDGFGLSDVIAGRKNLNQTVKLSSTRGLYVLPAGSIPSNPSEILHGEMFARVLAKLSEKFDHIIIDSPPVIPVTDARILSASADLTILVLRAQKSTRRVSIQAVESLRSVGARILGTVVNDVPRRRGGYGYYSYGYYHQAYYGGKNGRKNLEGPGNGAAEPVAVSSNGNGQH